MTLPPDKNPNQNENKKGGNDKMNPSEFELEINMKNAGKALTKEELQIFNILVGKVQEYEEALTIFNTHS